MQKPFTIKQLFLCVLILFLAPVLVNALGDEKGLTDIRNCLTKENGMEECMVGTMTDERIYPGKGYSLDTHKISVASCYDVMVRSSNASPQGAVMFSSAMSYDDLVKMFNFVYSAKFDLKFFSAGVESDYLNSIQETELSYSLNYGQYAVSTVDIEPNGYGIEALNDRGKKAYNQDYKNGNVQKFRTFCGDNFITSFRQGAILIMSLNLYFENTLKKEEFKGHVGASFGNIVQVATDFKDFASYNKEKNKMVIKAYQKGGDPTQLGQIIGSKDSGGQYYAVTCGINNMHECIKIAEGVYKYATETFSKQFNLPNQQGLASLGANFIDYLPIDLIGL